MSHISTQTKRVYKVGAVSKAIKQVVEGNPYLQEMLILGEISNYKPSRNGHLYFSLKDEEAVIDMVMYKWQAQHLIFIPEDGMKVYVKGSVSFYEKSGRLQIIANKMALDGVGNLHQKFEELKKNLEKEGLFASDKKKPIPTFPKSIGVVTSQTGAAVRDIITTIRRRYPIAKIFLYPVVVQGEHAAPSIVEAVEFFNREHPVDTLIVGRGGGSIEDLWAFNEEVVARAIHLSHIPVISAVGHETDTTIADFVADVRAATPTGAAELATPYTVAELKMQNNKSKDKMAHILQRTMKERREKKERIQKNLLFRHPERKLGEMVQTRDRLLENLSGAMGRRMERYQSTISHLSLRLNNENPAQRVKELKQRNEHLQSLLVMHVQAKQTDSANRFRQRMIQLDGLSPLKIMSKGYSLTYKENAVIKTIDSLEAGDTVEVKMADGSYEATITNIRGGNNNEQ